MSDTSGITLPPFFCPFEEVIHPKAESITQRTTDWLDDFRFYRNDIHRAWILASETGDAMARIFPNGDEDAVVLASSWVLSHYALDDMKFEFPGHTLPASAAAELAARSVRFFEAPGDPALGNEPFAPAMRDIITRLTDMTGPTQIQRFIHAWQHWLMSILWRLSNGERGHHPDPDSYTRMRLAECGGWVTMAWSEVTSGLHIPDHEMHSPPMRAAIEASFLVMGWDNDFVTYAQEQRADPTSQNIISALAQHHRCSPQEALEEAVILRDRAMSLFLQLHQQLKPTVSDGARRYLDDLGHAIRSNLDWGTSTLRHTSPSPSPSPRTEMPRPGTPIPVTFTNRPRTDRTDPLPMPAVAWWWDQLSS